MTVRKIGRPDRHDAKRREQRFAELLAEGATPRKAGREARVDPWRAFTLASKAEFWLQVAAARGQKPRI